MINLPKKIASGKILRRALCTSMIAFATISVSSSLAQTVEDNSVPQTSLNIPEGLTFFDKNNPNVRRATAVVNGQIITGTDVDQRVALLIAASNNEPSLEELQRLRLQVLRNLIDETLQIQAAVASEITVSETQVGQTYARVANENFGQDTTAMDKYLTSIGSSANSLKQQIRGELAWQRLLSRNITPFVNVADEEVNELIKRLEESKGVEEYRIGEIYLSANSSNAEQIAANATKIIGQIRQGGSFVAYARQFSESSTAAQGGDLGYLRLETLPAEMAAAARQMQPGQIVGPVQIPGGFVIVYMIDKREILTADPRDALLSLKQLSISFPSEMSPEKATARAAEFAAATQQIRGCGDADRVAASIGASIVDNDQVSVRSLPAALQSSLLDMSIGETTPPFGSAEQGIRVLVLCGRDDPKVAAGPSFSQIMQGIEDERIGKRAQTYLRDLRRDAVIDYN